MAVCKENCCETENVLSKLQQLKEQAEVLIHFDIIIDISQGSQTQIESRAA